MPASDSLDSAKGSQRTLAVLGGSPRFEQPLHVNKPSPIDRDRLYERIDGSLDRSWFSDGVLVREFESEIARVTGARHCVATCNGTLAIEVALRSLDVTGEVIVPSFTYIAAVQALRWLGLEPVYCDVDPATHNLDPAQVESLISSDTSAILGVHLWGHPCDIESLEALSERHGLTLVFDAAHALGSEYRGRPVGGFGSAEIFSFHATKYVSAAEGGAITTNDDALAARLRAATAFGFGADGSITEPGTNAKMSELSAAMGLTLLERMDDLIAANHRTLERYADGLRDVPGIAIFTVDSGDRTNAQYVVTTVDESVTSISRDDVLKALQAERILAKPYFQPGCHRLDPLGPRSRRSSLTTTEELAETVLVLPGGSSVTADEVDGVCETLAAIVGSAAEVSAAL